MNRYFQYAAENAAEIERLKGQIARFQQRGVRLNSIPAIEAEIATLEKQIVSYRGTGKIVEQKYGKHMGVA